MLKLNHAPTFKATVQLPMAGGVVAEFKCEFRWMSDKHLSEFLFRMRTLDSLNRPSMRAMQSVMRFLSKLPIVGNWAQARVIHKKTAFEHLDEIMVGWEDVDMEWSEAAFNRLMEIQPNALALILGAWAKSLADNRLGN